MQWYLKVFRDFATFTGRARRREYWTFVLVNLGVAVIASLLDGVLFGDAAVLSSIYTLVVIVPGLAVSMRRLHDTGRSGWWFLISFVPLVGFIVMLVYMTQDSDPGPNAYGPSPKQAAPLAPPATA